MALFAIINYHWPICWMICFIQFVRLSFQYWLWRRVIPYTWRMAGVTGQQRMLTLPRHLILPLVLAEVRVSLLFTVDYSMYFIWTLVLTADFSILPDWTHRFWLIDWLIDYLRFYVPLKNSSLIWRCHHSRWRAAKFSPMHGAQGLWAGRGLYRATPAVTRGLGFSGLIRSTAPFSRLLTADCSVHLIWTHWFWLPIFEFKLGLMADVTGQ
jgi:hypothetical protein